jgi:hypothetical protein
VTREPHLPSDDGHRDAAQRTLERACDVALFGDVPTADDSVTAEAAGLDFAREIEAFELIVGQLEAERIGRDAESAMPSDAMPEDLRARLLQLAEHATTQFVKPKATSTDGASDRATSGRATSTPTSSTPATRTQVGSDLRPVAPAPLPFTRPRTQKRDWLIAAACIAFGAASTFALLRAGREVPQEFPTDPARFVSLYPSAVRWPWTPTGDGSVVGEVRGEAIFDPKTSRGLLVIEGLAANDPTREQYQLWIFDSSRDDRYPVDGGVFDVPAVGRALVPVTAKLNVDNPVLFAVTVEKPGGVVVSDRRIAILAKP